MPEFKFEIMVTEVSQQDVFIEADTAEDAYSIAIDGEFDWDNDVKFGEYLESEHEVVRLIAIEGKPVKSFDKE